MTEEDFDQRADNAALELKKDISSALSKRFGKDIVLPETKVEVGPDGRPPAALPPANSYIGMARQLAAEQQAPAPSQELQQEAPPVQEAATETLQPQELDPQVSDNAQNRIRGLVTDLRDKDQALQTLQAEHSTSASTIEEMRAKFEALEGSYRTMIEQNLESMEPEVRESVIRDARMQEAIAASESRMMSFFKPQFERIVEKEAQSELTTVASKYAGFDYEIHPVLIDEFRKRNPACSVEMAFKAVADPEALGRSALPAHPVPPVIQPGSGGTVPKGIPSHTAKSDPEAELVDESRRAAKLARSNNPDDYKKAIRLYEQNIAGRLFGQR